MYPTYCHELIDLTRINEEIQHIIPSYINLVQAEM
jgi:hypothetical protein